MTDNPKPKFKTTFYSPTDAALVCGCSASTVKRVGDELKFDIGTEGGGRLYTKGQVMLIKAEIDRRKADAGARKSEKQLGKFA